MGYTLPKPLIVVDGKPIIHHIVDLFGPQNEFHFVVNQDHLRNQDFRLRDTLEAAAPGCNIIPIPPHRRGPVHACLAALNFLRSDDELVVNYADFSCVWSFGSFVDEAKRLRLDGSVPAYRGFHPHSGGATNYAYIEQKKGSITAIREKQPFTSNKTEEFASTGTYYFRRSDLMQKYFNMLIEKQVSLGGEFYVSSAMQLMVEDGLNVGVHEVPHFMQWGTPEDLREYNHWSKNFRSLADFGSQDLEIKSTGDLLILASGRGSRFFHEGYGVPKPFLQLSGSSLAQQLSKVRDKRSAVSISLPPGQERYGRELDRVELIPFDDYTDGQACSTMQLLERMSKSPEGNFTVLPSDTLFADSSGRLSEIISKFGSRPFVIPWVTYPSPYARENPSSFGWLERTGSSVSSYIKKAPPTAEALQISGAFTFSSIEDFKFLHEEQLKLDLTVNGEYYLDSLIDLAQELGFEVGLFEPSVCITVGTPFEFETFRYWQCAFDQWSSHPYSLENDPFVSPEAVAEARLLLRTTAHRASEWKAIQDI